MSVNISKIVKTISGSGKVKITTDRCLRRGIYKPHLHMAYTQTAEGNKGVTLKQTKRLLELDKEFYNKYLKGKVNFDSVYENIYKTHGLEWYCNIPQWLVNAFTVMDGQGYYQNKILLDPLMPYFDMETIPTFIDVVSHLKPSTFITFEKSTYLGKTELKIKKTEPLSMEDTIRLFGHVAKYKNGKGEYLSDINLNIPNEVVNFLQDQSPIEDRETIIALAKVAVSPTPYEAAMRFLLGFASSRQEIPIDDFMSFRLLATDDDVKHGRIVRKDGSLLLNTTQALEVLGKMLGKYAKGKRLLPNEVYRYDYQFWHAIRFFTNPMETAVKYHRNTKYLDKFEGRMKKLSNPITIVNRK